MKPFVLVVLWAVLSTSSWAADPAVGDERASVIKQLGKPRGRAAMEDKENLLYDRGFVELTTGRVTKVKLVTPEELAARETRLAEEARQAEKARLARVAEGEKARDKILKDDGYKAKPASEKVAVWEKFRQDHPDVTPPEEFQQAVAAQQEADRKAAQATALAAKEEAPKPRMSASKKRKMRRTGEAEEDVAPGP